MRKACRWRTAGRWYKRGILHPIRKTYQKTFGAGFYLADWIFGNKSTVHGTWLNQSVNAYYRFHNGWWLCSYSIKRTSRRWLVYTGQGLPSSHWLSLASPLPLLVQPAMKSASFYQLSASDPSQVSILHPPFATCIINRWFQGLAFILTIFLRI